MSDIAILPLGARPFVEFSTLLRTNRFAVAPEQTQTFVEAVGLLGPKSMADIYRSARATLAPDIDRIDEFDALYRLHFLGHSLAGGDADADDDDEIKAQDERDGSMDPPDAEDENEAGAEAASAEALSLRRFEPLGEAEVLRRFRRVARSRLPRRKSYRRAPSSKGDAWNIRRTLRDAVRRDGEILVLPKLKRKTRQRRILLLIDISGSMKAQTDATLRFAHALASVADRLEIFTLGTRLTRISRVLRLKNQDLALATAGTVVADWDGGTRLGDALQAFLAIPRFKGFARGALVVVVSDGLERGDPSAMIQAVQDMSRLAWSILWLSPLAADRDFTPETVALKAVLPFVDRFADGGSIERLCTHILNAERSVA